MDLGGWLEAYVGLRCSISEQYMFETFCWETSLNNFAIFLHRDLKEETPDTLLAQEAINQNNTGRENTNYGNYLPDGI